MTVSLAIGSSHLWGVSEEVPEGYIITVLSDYEGHQDVKTGDDARISGLYRVFDYRIRNDGLYRFTVYHTEGTWTHIVTDPADSARDLWINKAVRDIDFSQLPTTDWSDAWYVEQSYPKHCYSKLFLAAGNADYSQARIPAHTTWEIIPETDIRTVGTGNFTVRVLYKNTPFSGAGVMASPVGREDLMVNGTTDVSGRITLPLKQPGTWIIKSDTGTDPRIVSLIDLQKGPHAINKTLVGPVYRYTLVLAGEHTAAGG